MHQCTNVIFWRRSLNIFVEINLDIVSRVYVSRKFLPPNRQSQRWTQPQLHSRSNWVRHQQCAANRLCCPGHSVLSPDRTDGIDCRQNRARQPASHRKQHRDRRRYVRIARLYKLIHALHLSTKRSVVRAYSRNLLAEWAQSLTWPVHRRLASSPSHNQA